MFLPGSLNTGVTGDEILLSYVGVSKNNGTPKSSILIGFSIINHPFWGTPIFGNTHVAQVVLIDPNLLIIIELVVHKLRRQKLTLTGFLPPNF